MAVRVLQNAFNGGEVSPGMYGRVDDQSYPRCCAQVKNFVCLPQGPVVNRPGFKRVAETKNSGRARLVPFVFSNDQTMVLEFGDRYVRFHAYGKQVLDASGNPLEVATTYTADEVFDLDFVQSYDVIKIVHPSHKPAELTRVSATSWTLADISFGAPLATPSTPSLSYTCNDKDATSEQKSMYSISYKITALKYVDGAAKESAASSARSISANLYLGNSKITASWSAVSGATHYRVYKSYSGVFGYIGETESTSFVDDNIASDESITPPRYDTAFNGAGQYPSSVTYFEQRCVLAGAINKPHNVWMTRPSTENDMSYTLPAQDDNRISQEVMLSGASKIRHLVPLRSLILMTSDAIVRVVTANDDVITPTSFGAKPQSNFGASNVKPLIVGSSALYVSARGGHVRELGYNNSAGGFMTGDVSIRADHLFGADAIIDAALMQAPESIAWFVTESGKLLGCTYLPEQSVAAWHQHETKGEFESICVVPETSEDILYAVVKRTLGGRTVRMVERMNEINFDSLKDAYYVDCGGTYDGTETTSISIPWLNGETVSILADGAVLPQQVVTNNKVTLAQPAAKVHIGLPYTSTLKTLPAAYQTQDASYGKGHKANINKVFIRVYRSSSIFAGPSSDKLHEVRSRSDELFGEAPRLLSEEVALNVAPSWAETGQIVVEQQNPLPLKIVGITLDLAQ